MIAGLLLSYFLYQFQVPVQHEAAADGALTVQVQEFEASSIPRGAQRVPMLRLYMKADCAAPVRVQSIDIQRRGLGFNDDIAAVYAVQSERRISSARTIARKDGFAYLRLRQLELHSCEEKQIDILADFSSTASVGGEHQFILRKIDAGNSTVHIKTMERVSSTVQTAPVSSGQIDVEYVRLNTPIRYGSNRLLSRFRLTADGRDHHLLYAITFTNDGSASDDDLQNLYLQLRDQHVTRVKPYMDGDRIRLEFNPPLPLRKNQTLLFSLRGDVRASRRRTIQFLIEEGSDIEATPFIDRS